MTKHDHHRGWRALVVDDSELVRTLVARVMSSAGYHVDVAESAATALAHTEGHSYDVAVIDVNLADGERGYDVVAALRARGDDLGARCLLLTGGATDGLPEDVAVLVKPFLAEQLVEAAQRLHPGPDRPDPGAP